MIYLEIGLASFDKTIVFLFLFPLRMRQLHITRARLIKNSYLNQFVRWEYDKVFAE